MSERSGSTWIQLQQHDQPFHTVLLRCCAFLQPLKLTFQTSQDPLGLCVPLEPIYTFYGLFTCACLPSLTPWPTITSICKFFGGKKNQSSCSKTGGKGVACMTFALCCRAIFLSSWPHFGKKKVIFTSGNLANWMAIHNTHNDMRG